MSIKTLGHWSRLRRTTWVALASMAAFLLLGAAAPIMPEDPGTLWLFFLPFFAIAASTLVLLKIGRTKAAVIQSIVVSWMSLTGATFYLGGVTSHVVAGFPVLIAMAGVLWHLRAAVGMTFVSVLSLAAIAVTQSTGHLPTSVVGTPTGHAFLAIVATVIITLSCVFVGRQLLDAAITSAQETQRQLQEAQQMEAIGQLAGRVAHDFNNLLTVILGQSELLLCQPLDSPTRNQVKQIAMAGDRAKTLTQQLLAFARKQIIAPQTLDPNQAIRGLDRLMESLAGKKIQIEFDLSPGCGAIKVDPHQFDQLLAHLVANARTAMPTGGRLTIRSAATPAPGADVQDLPAPVRNGAWVRLTIEDTGIGLDEDAQRHIFEPFYAPADKAQPAGIGLAAVDGIVAQNGGHIVITSAPGKGTRFDVYLPEAGPEAPAVTTATPPPQSAGTAGV